MALRLIELALYHRAEVRGGGAIPPPQIFAEIHKSDTCSNILSSINDPPTSEFMGKTFQAAQHTRGRWKFSLVHKLRTPGEEIAFTARLNSHSQIFRYDRSRFCLPHRPKFSDFLDLCLHWV